MPEQTTKTATLGILGGGQLGLLLAQAARAQGVRVHLYLPEEGPVAASALAAQVFVGKGWLDEAALMAFVQNCDVVALENEFIPVALLSKIAQSGQVTFIPDLSAYGIFQHKAREKELAHGLGIKLSPWQIVNSLTEVLALQQTWGRLILKTTTGGYDGYGNLSVDADTSSEVISAFLGRGEVLAEAFVSFTHELAVVVARTPDQITCFPVAETIQSQHICHFVLAPARLPAAILKEAQSIAQELITGAQGSGVFGVEFFLTTDQQLLYNETAPRPHNSAHFTIDGCDVSQFEMIVRIALEQKLSTPKLLSPVVGMLNLLGTRHGPPRLEPEADFTALSQGQLCLYQKTSSRPGRKMGHFNLRGETAYDVLTQLQSLQQRYQL